MNTSNVISMSRGLVAAWILGLAVPLAAMDPAPAADLGRQLREAAEDGNKVLVEQLLAQGADVNAVDSCGRTALGYAMIFRRWAVFELLLQQHGVDINARNSYGRTVLDLACFENLWAVVEWLLQEPGIAINALDSRGITALDIAIASNDQGSHAYLIALLQERGALTGQQLQAQQQPAGASQAQHIPPAAGQLIQAVKAYSQKFVIYLAQNCAICQEGEGDTDREGVVLLPCGHAFHADCLQGWFDANKNTCPECRAVVDAEALVALANTEDMP